MYYVRKFTNATSINRIQCVADIKQIESDILRLEMSTQENTLSFWKCEDINELEDTIKAILLSTTDIKTSKFILLDSELVDDYGLCVECDEKTAKTGYKGFEKLHVNMLELTYEKLGELLKLFRLQLSDAGNIKTYDKDKVKEMIKKVIDDNKLDRDRTHERLLSAIDKYCTEK